MASFPGTTTAFKASLSVDLSNSDAVLILLHINQAHYKHTMLTFFFFFANGIYCSSASAFKYIFNLLSL